MSNITIPTTPPPATTSPDSSSTSASSDDRFDDTLRKTQTQAQPQSKPHGDAHAPDDASDAQPHDDHKVQAGSKHKGDNHHDTKKQPSTPVTAAPVTPATPAPLRQPPATHGKPLPVPGKPVTAKASVASTTKISLPAADTRGPAATLPARPPAKSHAKPATTAPTEASPDVTQPELTVTPKAPRKDADKPLDTGGKQSTSPAPQTANTFATHLTQLASAQHGAQPAVVTSQVPQPPAQLTMQASPGQPQFAQETAQNVAWMAGQNIQQAKIQLNPRKLGPIHVEVTTHHDQVNVTFAVQHPQTVNALQQTLPQLHDMLAQQGLNLGQASVGQQAPGQQQHAAPPQYAGNGSGGNSINTEPDVAPVWRSARIATPGRVDDFA